MAAKDFSLKGYSAAQIREAEKRMFKIMAGKGTPPPGMRGPVETEEAPEVNPLDTVYTRDERLQMAYAPVVLAESIWQYVDKVLAYCAANRIAEVRKLSRAVQAAKKSYYDFLRKSIDSAHLVSAREAAAEFQSEFGFQMQITWYTINGELLKRYPTMMYREMRTDAHCAVLLVHVLKGFCRDVDKDIEKRLGTKTNTLNPKIGNLDVIMDGYIGDYEIDRTVLVTRCETILRSVMNAIKYRE